MEALVLRHRAWSGIVVLVLFVVLGFSVVSLLGRTGSRSNPVDAVDVAVGDCFDVGGENPAAQTWVVGRTLVMECQKAHDHEVFYELKPLVGSMKGAKR